MHLDARIYPTGFLSFFFLFWGTPHHIYAQSTACAYFLVEKSIYYYYYYYYV
jgi:hypothetical protein